MQTFSYTLVEPSGRKKNGLVEAASREAAIQRLSSEGQFVLNIEVASASRIAGNAAQQEEKKTKGVSKADLALFTRRLSDLALAGLPLDRVLQVISEQSESQTLSDVSLAALEEVRGGRSVSDALAEHPKYFSPVFTQTLRAGEASGQFAEVAAKLADFQESEVARRSTIASALAYPALLSMAAVAVVAFLLTYVVPKLSTVFDQLKGKLPTTTVILISLSNFVTDKWMLILGGIVGSAIVYRGWVATESGALTRDTLILRLPGFGAMLRKSIVSRYARVLGTLVYGGVPILEALNLAGLAAGNRYFQRLSNVVESEVREGSTIHQAMRDAGGFPPVLTHIVAIGEETGDLPKMLNRVSTSLEFEVDTSLKRLTSMLEPLIIVIMGAIVAFVVLSILLPIFSAQELVK